MRRCVHGRAPVTLATGLALVAAAAWAQTTAPPDREAVVRAASEVMTKARYCSLVTLGLDGELQARVVDPFAPDESLTIWIGTRVVTRKVAEVSKDPRATLVCYEPADQAYVTWIGRADVVREAAEKARHWKPEWAAYYKDANRGDDYVLIRFRPRRVEVVSPAHKLMNDPTTWQPASVSLSPGD
jgi:general stress protein 26